MTDETMVRYLRRLGVEKSPPSAASLAELHRAQVEREESLRRITIEGRGGYCFHLNGAFAELLSWLGYTVTRHAAGVYDHAGPDASTIRNHVALTVHDLPHPDNPGGRWWVDAGLGEGPHDPLPLTPGSYVQGPTTFTIGEADGVGDWSLRVAPEASFAGVSVLAAPVALGVFEGRHEFNATSPASNFATTVTAQRRAADRIDILRGCVLTSRGTTTSTQTLERRNDWLAAIGDIFGLQLAVSPEAIDRLWSRVAETHRSRLETFGVETAGR
jgi:N-hydroxyarylamine O-acetyltransferase